MLETLQAKPGAQRPDWPDWGRWRAKSQMAPQLIQTVASKSLRPLKVARGSSDQQARGPGTMNRTWRTHKKETS